MGVHLGAIFNKSKFCSDTIAAALEYVESAVLTLDPDNPPDGLSDFFEAMHKCMRAVFQYLETNEGPLEDPITLGVIRLAVVWTACEPTEFSKEWHWLVPRLHKLPQDALPMITPAMLKFEPIEWVQDGAALLNSFLEYA